MAPYVRQGCADKWTCRDIVAGQGHLVRRVASVRHVYRRKSTLPLVAKPDRASAMALSRPLTACW